MAKAIEEYSSLFPTLERVRMWKAIRDHEDREEMLKKEAEKRGEKRGKIEGKIEGKVEGKVEVAKLMLSQGISLEQTFHYTGLSQETLENVFQELKNQT